MKIFIDTEFLENGETIDLISIGLVREDDATYYAVSNEFNMTLACADPWIKVNVIDRLNLKIDQWKPRAIIAEDIVNFVGNSPEFWGDYCSYDWVALCQLHGKMIDLPKGWPMFCNDVQQLRKICSIGKFPDFENDAEHNALSDAKECKYRHDYAAFILSHSLNRPYILRRW